MPRVVISIKNTREVSLIDNQYSKNTAFNAIFRITTTVTNLVERVRNCKWRTVSVLLPDPLRFLCDAFVDILSAFAFIKLVSDLSLYSFRIWWLLRSCWPVLRTQQELMALFLSKQRCCFNRVPPWMLCVYASCCSGIVNDGCWNIALRTLERVHTDKIRFCSMTPVLFFVCHNDVLGEFIIVAGKQKKNVFFFRLMLPLLFQATTSLLLPSHRQHSNFGANHRQRTSQTVELRSIALIFRRLIDLIQLFERVKDAKKSYPVNRRERENSVLLTRVSRHFMRFSINVLFRGIRKFSTRRRSRTFRSSNLNANAAFRELSVAGAR